MRKKFPTCASSLMECILIKIFFCFNVRITDRFYAIICNYYTYFSFIVKQKFTLIFFQHAL